LLFKSFAIGQNDSIILPEVMITAPFNQPIQNAVFIIKHLPDSNEIGVWTPLTDLMANDGVYFKSYSANGLTTASNRGFGASQTKVYWNGFLLNSPLNGTMDLNLINIDASSTKVTFVKSNIPVMGGLSGPGGSIWIEPSFVNSKNESSINLRLGSFNTYNITAALQTSKKSFVNILRFGAGKADNNYKYRSVLNYKRPYVRLKDAESSQWSLSDNMLIKLKASQLNINLLFNDNKRSLPPTITSSGPAAFQKDRAIKAGLSYDSALGKFSQISVNAGYSYDELLYYFVKNEKGHASYFVHTFPLSINSSTRLLHHEIKLNFNNIFYNIQSSEIEVPEEINHNLTIEINNGEDHFINYGGSFQKQLTTFYNPPPSYRLYTEGKFPKNFKMSLSYARTHQLPTLNDRYWPLSGNVDLLVEESSSFELNTNYFNSNGSGNSFLISASLFHNTVDNWIAWIPVSGDFWSPFNVQKVISKGVDINMDRKFRLRENVNIKVNYNLNISDPKIDKIYLGSPAIVGKKLIYVPNFQQGISATVYLSNSNFYAFWRNVGKRFTSFDNDKAYQLNSYSLFDIGYKRSVRIKESRINVGLKANNIFDSSYETIAYRPMAGRSFEVSAAWIIRYGD
jgi:iron complex outermembrane receptor protein